MTKSFWMRSDDLAGRRRSRANSLKRGGTLMTKSFWMRSDEWFVFFKMMREGGIEYGRNVITR